jgi:hypothetical protein
MARCLTDSAAGVERRSANESHEFRGGFFWMDKMAGRQWALGALLLTLLSLSSAGAHWEEPSPVAGYLFGYMGVDWDLHLYSAEVESNSISTNVQVLSAGASAESLAEKLDFLGARGQRAIIILDRLLFINDSTLRTPCGAHSWRSRLDFKAKFDKWLGVNRPHLSPERVAALVINGEVNNRCIPSTSLDAVTQYVKAQVPLIPAVAGYGRSDGAQPLPATIPAALDAVAFFKYRVFDPRTDAGYRAEYDSLKSKLTPEQRIILVADGFYDSGHAARGWAKWYLGHLAQNYMHMALGDPTVVGLVFFNWPGFAEGGETKLGTRDLPQSVRDRHREVSAGLNIRPYPSQ